MLSQSLQKLVRRAVAPTRRTFQQGALPAWATGDPWAMSGAAPAKGRNFVDGEWRDGQFHGFGAKRYSRGGGYEGEWVSGKRQGRGTTFYAYGRWEGPFEGDRPHGEGTMYVDGEGEGKPGEPSSEAAAASLAVSSSSWPTSSTPFGLPNW